MDRNEIKLQLPLLEEFERRGVEFKRVGSSLMAKCPFHEDNKPSLSLDEKDQVFNCHGCGAKGSVIDAWAAFEGIPIPDAIRAIEAHLGHPAAKERPSTIPTQKEVLEKIYSYRDENDKLLFEVCRFSPKTFRQRVPEGSGWKWGLNGVRRVLYNLSEVISCDTAVYLCEGEKDADLLIRMGLCATTNPMGAGKWEDSYTPFLKAKTVIILPDNDPIGEKHCHLLCEKIGPVARGVRIIKIPPPHKDVSDWRTSFQSDREFGMNLLSLAQAAKTVAGADTLPIYSMEELEDQYKESVLNPKRAVLDFSCISPRLGKLIRPLIPGDFSAIMSDTGVGKTFVLQNIAVKCGLKVLFFELELANETMFERFASVGSGANIASVETHYREGSVTNWRRSIGMDKNIFLCSQAGLTTAQIKNYIIQSEMKIGEIPPLVIIDYIGLIRCPGSRYERLSNIAEDLKTIAKETGVVILTSSQIARKADDATAEINLHDAKDSGSIENSVQLAIGMWRDPDPDLKTRIWTKILKNTKGAPGARVPMQFNPATLQLFEEVNYVESGESSQPQNGSGKKSGSSYPQRRMGSR